MEFTEEIDMRTYRDDQVDALRRIVTHWTEMPMDIDFDDFQYTMLVKRLFPAADYDLRTGPERLHAQADDHERRLPMC